MKLIWLYNENQFGKNNSNKVTLSINKEILNKGLKYLFWALPTAFIGPTIIHFGLINKQQPLFPAILGIGIFISFAAIILIFKGVVTIVKSLE
jgi:Family of unknown function (DUF6095)